MKKFSDYLEIIDEGRKINLGTVKIADVKASSYVNSDVISYAQHKKNINKKISKIEDEVNKAFQKFKSKYAEKIEKQEMFDFQKYDKYTEGLSGLLYRGKIKIYDSLNNSNDIEKFYKAIFGQDTPDIKNENFPFMFLFLFDQNVTLIDNETTINMFDEIVNKINDESIRSFIQGAKKGKYRFFKQKLF